MKNCNTPPVPGSVFWNSTIVLPALAAACTASWSILPATVSENLTIAVPKGTNWFPKPSRSFSPAKNWNTPPVPGREFWSSTIVFPALAAALTAS